MKLCFAMIYNQRPRSNISKRKKCLWEAQTKRARISDSSRWGVTGDTLNFPAAHRENTWCTTLLRKEFIRDLVPRAFIGS